MATIVATSAVGVSAFATRQAPAGQDNNWVTTVKGGKWRPIFRLYGPERAFFDKTWKLPDFEAVE
jgi:hypothetical protein